jgi:catechol 2,3-dioxygenase-like lactoylglutathione lyase family enzyme
MQAKRIFETCLYAKDLAAAERFYTRVLGLEVVTRMEVDRGIAFRCGAGVLLVFNPDRTRIKDSDLPAHGTEGAGHTAFVARADELDGWRRHLQACGVGIETEIEWSPGQRSIYFRDPAGNSVELAPPTLWGFGAGDRPIPTV